MARVTLQIDTETLGAVRELVKFAKAQDQVERSTRRAGRSSREQQRATSAMDRQLEKTGASVRTWIQGMLGAQAIVSVLNRVKTAVIEVDETFASFARKQSAIGVTATSLSALNPGREAESIRLAILAGARKGIKAEDAISVVQTLQSIPENKGDLDSALKDAATAFNLINLGVGTQEAIATSKFFRRAGKSSARGATSLLTAADTSAFGPTGLAQASPALPFFSDPEIGFAIASNITNVLNDPTQLRTFTQRAAQGLNFQNPLTQFLEQQLAASGLFISGESPSNIGKALGIDSKKVKELLSFGNFTEEFGTDFSVLNEIEKLRFIRGIVPETRSDDSRVVIRALEKSGITEKREITALAALTGDTAFKALEDKLALSRERPDALAAQRIETEFANNPFFEQKQLRSRSEALIESGQLFSEEGRQRGLKRLGVAAGLATSDEASAFFINQDTGEANFRGRVAHAIRPFLETFAVSSAGAPGSFVIPRGLSPQPSRSPVPREFTAESLFGEQKLRFDELERRLGIDAETLQKSLDENTSAMRENTAAMQGAGTRRRLPVPANNESE